MQQKNYLWFIVLWLLLVVGWMELSRRIWGPARQEVAKQEPTESKGKAERPPPPAAGRGDALKAAAGVLASVPPRPDVPRAPRPTPAVKPTDPSKLVRLGRRPGAEGANPFHLE